MSNRGFFYDRIVIVNAVYSSLSQFKFPFSATHILIAAQNMKNTEVIQFSFNGAARDGELFSFDSPISMDGLIKNRIWFLTSETQNPNAEVRVWAWHRGGN